MLSRTLIVNYLSNYLFSILSEDCSILLIDQLCLTLHSIIEIPSLSSIHFWSNKILKYIQKKKICLLSIIEYLILIEHNSIHQNSLEIISILNKYLNETGISQENLNIICELLVLISSCNYSHELFQKKILEKIEDYLKESKESE